MCSGVASPKFFLGQILWF